MQRNAPTLTQRKKPPAIPPPGRRPLPAPGAPAPDEADPDAPAKPSPEELAEEARKRQGDLLRVARNRELETFKRDVDAIVQHQAMSLRRSTLDGLKQEMEEVTKKTRGDMEAWSAQIAGVEKKMETITSIDERMEALTEALNDVVGRVEAIEYVLAPPEDADYYADADAYADGYDPV